MKIELLVIASGLIALTEASMLPWLSLMVMSLNEQVEGFFSIFRRRPKSPERSEGNVGFSPQGNFFNPYGHFSGFPPSFTNGFQAFRPPQQSWFPPNTPSQPSSQGSNFEGQPEFGSEQNLGQIFGHERDVRFDDQPPAINTEEAESFFTLLAETDENKCISRLVCEMGADPGNAGELGTTVNEIIGSLTDFPPGTKVFEYNEILRKGRSEGMTACLTEYSSCDEETYKIMKNNAPSD